MSYQYRIFYSHTLGSSAKETARYNWVLIVTELFNIAVNDIHAKKSVRYGWVLVLTELVCKRDPVYI